MPLLDQQERQAGVAALGRGLHGGDHEVGAHAVGDEGLRAVDHVAAVHLPRLGADAGHVGPRARLGDAQRGDPSRRGWRGPGSAASAPRSRTSTPGGVAMPRVRADAGGHAARAAAAQLLGEHRVVHVVAALAAVLLRVLQPQEPGGRQLVEHLVGKPARVLPLGGVGAQLLGHEAADGLAQVLVLLGEGRDGARPVAAGTPLVNARLTASCGHARRGRSPAGRRSGSSGRRGGRRGPRGSGRRGTRTTPCRGRAAARPTSGARQVMVHSITTRSPSSMASSMLHWPSMFSTAQWVCSPMVPTALVRAQARVVVGGVLGEVGRPRGRRRRCSAPRSRSARGRAATATGQLRLRAPGRSR